MYTGFTTMPSEYREVLIKSNSSIAAKKKNCFDLTNLYYLHLMVLFHADLKKNQCHAFIT